MSAETFEEKTTRNGRVQRRYDALMQEGKHGHYETMFRVVREEIQKERLDLEREFDKLRWAGNDDGWESAIKAVRKYLLERAE